MPRKLSAYEVVASARRTARQGGVNAGAPILEPPKNRVTAGVTTPETSVASTASSPAHDSGMESRVEILTKQKLSSESRPDVTPPSRNVELRQSSHSRVSRNSQQSGTLGVNATAHVTFQQTSQSSSLSTMRKSTTSSSDAPKSSHPEILNSNETSTFPTLDKTGQRVQGTNLPRSSHVRSVACPPSVVDKVATHSLSPSMPSQHSEGNTEAFAQSTTSAQQPPASGLSARTAKPTPETVQTAIPAHQQAHSDILSTTRPPQPLSESGRADGSSQRVPAVTLSSRLTQSSLNALPTTISSQQISSVTRLVGPKSQAPIPTSFSAASSQNKTALELRERPGKPPPGTEMTTMSSQQLPAMAPSTRSAQPTPNAKLTTKPSQPDSVELPTLQAPPTLPTGQPRRCPQPSCSNDDSQGINLSPQKKNQINLPNVLYQDKSIPTADIPATIVKSGTRERQSAFVKVSASRPLEQEPTVTLHVLDHEPTSSRPSVLPKASGDGKIAPDGAKFSKQVCTTFDASSPDNLAIMSAAFSLDPFQSNPEVVRSVPASSSSSSTKKGLAPTRLAHNIFDASSPEALAAMTAAFTFPQGNINLSRNVDEDNLTHFVPPHTNDEFSRYPVKTKTKHADTSDDNPIAPKRYHHRVVDLGSLHGNKFSAFVFCTVLEIVYFWTTQKPSTLLRLLNLVLAFSLYSGVFDTHVQRAPLGMMLNRLAAWILALLALSTSVYTTPAGASWQLGEMRILNMVGTFVFPLALLDSINVLRAEIRHRNFILKGFLVESLYLYCFLLGVPVARVLLSEEDAISLFERYKVAETIFMVAIFTALSVAIEYFFVCQVAAGNFSKEFWQGMTSILWGFFHAPGCAVLVWKFNGVKAGLYFYIGSFIIFSLGRLVESVLEEIGLLFYRETSTAPSPKKLD